MGMYNMDKRNGSYVAWDGKTMEVLESGYYRDDERIENLLDFS